MENLSYCLNATMPVFAMMVLGFLLNKLGLLSDEFASQLNKFVFRVPLPVLVFKDMADEDFFTVWDGKFVLFCFCVTAVSILISMAASFLVKDASSRGEFVQASYRSSAALLGVALMENLYGSAGAAPLMMVGAVPLYNVAAVVTLNIMRPGQGRLNGTVVKKTLIGVVTNPILLGIAVGCLWSVLRLPQPAIFTKTVSSVAATATPLGLIAMGASFDWKKATGALRPALLCTAFKLVIFVALFLPAAVALGFRTDKLVAILVMLGAATTVSCYVMAKNLGYEGALTTNTVMLTTCLAAFTLTGWLYLVRSMGLI
jgi:hypothetical protein